MELSPQVTTISFLIMLITMSINIFVTKWERTKGEELKSDILKADSYHTASDVLTSLSVLAGLFAIQAGYPFIDPFVAIVIAGVIAWTAIIVLRDVLSSLTDRTRLDPQAIHTAVMTIPGIQHCHEIRTRGLSNHVFVDLSIHVEPSWSVEQAHTLATRVESFLMNHFDPIEDVVVHIEPEGHSAMESTKPIPITPNTPNTPGGK
jgi:cation diffusion facilitator family transporter